MRLPGSQKPIAMAALILGLCAAAQAFSQGLPGPAAAYNGFILGNGTFMSENTESMGNLAVGGTTILSNYTVADGIPGNSSSSTSPPDPARLVVGGALTATNGGVGNNQDGTIYYQNTADVPSLSGFTANGGTVGLSPSQALVNFTAAASQYTNLSDYLASLTANASPTISGSTLTLTGTASGLNIFSIAGSTLVNYRTIDISAPTGSTVLINVTGTSATLQNGMVNEDGVNSADVLYNFSQATSLSLDMAGGLDPEGSILAPDASVSADYGAMHGQLIADSYNGNTEFYDSTFTGALPTPVPLPATAGLLLGALLALLSWMQAPRRGAL